MSHYILFILIFLSLFYGGCDTEHVDLKAEVEFELMTGKQYKYNGHVVEIKDIKDSRCPLGVNCIWAGEAVVKFDCKYDDEDKFSFLMDTNDDTVFVVSNFRLKLLQVSPLPDNDQNIRQEDYRVRISLKEHFQ